MDLPLGFRFGVFFFAGGLYPNPLDIRFQRVNGLSVDVKTTTVVEGGQNLHTHRLPERIDYGNLTLERGMVIGSPLDVEFNTAMSTFQFAPCNVMVTLFGEDAAPLAAWLFLKAYPVKWATSALDATTDNIVIDTMELAYTKMQIMRV